MHALSLRACLGIALGNRSFVYLKSLKELFRKKERKEEKKKQKKKKTPSF
jgi:hypothetical protein